VDLTQSYNLQTARTSLGAAASGANTDITSLALSGGLSAGDLVQLAVTDNSGHASINVPVSLNPPTSSNAGDIYNLLYTLTYNDGAATHAFAFLDSTVALANGINGILGLDLGNIDNPDSQAVSGHVEIGQGLLQIGRDIGQDHRIRIMVANDHLPQKLPETGFIETAQQASESGSQTKSGTISFAQNPLKSKDRREGLHFNQTTDQPPFGIARQTEVGGQEMRVRILIGGSPSLGNRRQRARHVLAIREQAVRELAADRSHFIQKPLREEARGLSDRK